MILVVHTPDTGSSNAAVVIDTGDPSGLHLERTRWLKWLNDHPNRPLTMRTGFYPFARQMVTLEEGWASEVSLGTLKFHQVPVEQGLEAWFTSTNYQYAGTLGLMAMRPLQLIIDSKNMVLYARPKDTITTNYEYDRLGAVFVATNSLGEDLVAYVAPNSPASEAGIQNGDVLLSVDNDLVADLRSRPDFRNLVQKWQRPAGEEFWLMLKRDATIYNTPVKLRDILTTN